MNEIQRQCQNKLESERRSAQEQLNRSGDSTLHHTLKRHIAHKLNRIIQAQARLNTPEFGLCQHCQKAINTERLLAIPYVELCIDCQRQLEWDTQATQKSPLTLSRV